MVSATPATPASCALVGCGVVGTVLGLRLLRAGHPLIVHDRLRSRASTLLDAGARWADAPGDAARAGEVVITALPGAAEVIDVSRSDRGIWSGATKDTLWLQTSTVGPACARLLARDASGRGLTMLDAPVSAGAPRDAAPSLTIWVGGHVDHFDRARPLLDVLADRVIYCGGAGHAQVVKLVNAAVTHTLTAALGEALCLGVAGGVDLDVLRTALHHGTAQNRVLDELLPSSVFRGNFEAGLRLELAARDLELAEGLAVEAGLEPSLIRRTIERFAEARGRGWAEASAHAVIRLNEEEAGVSLRSAAMVDLAANQGDDDSTP